MATASGPGDVLRPSEGKTRFLRLTRLLICGGTKVMRALFDNKIPPAQLATRLGSPGVKIRLTDVKNKGFLTFCQWKVLYPPPGAGPVQSTSFDISLLFKLLRQKVISGLSPPDTGWDNLPSLADLSLPADMARIKYYRNIISHIDETMEIQESTFSDYWKEIKDALLRIVGRYASSGFSTVNDWKKEIDSLLTDPLTEAEKESVEELKKWYLEDMQLKEMAIETQEMVNEIQEMASETKEMANETQKMASEIKEMVNENNELLKYLISMKSKVAEPHQAASQGNVAEPHQAAPQGNVAEPHQAAPQGNDFIIRCAVRIEGVGAWLGGTIYVLDSLQDNPEVLINFVTNSIVPSGLVLVSFAFGSIKITVRVKTLEALDEILKRNKAGRLEKDLEKVLITEKMKNLANGQQIKFTVQIDEQKLMAIRKLLEEEDEEKGEYDDAISYGEKWLALAQACNNREAEMSACWVLFKAHLNKQEYDDCISYGRKFLSLAQDSGANKNVMATVYIMIGTAHLKKGEYGNAITYSKKGLAIAQECGDKENEMQTYIVLQ